MNNSLIAEFTNNQLAFTKDYYEFFKTLQVNIQIQLSFIFEFNIYFNQNKQMDLSNFQLLILVKTSRFRVQNIIELFYFFKK
jgi:hypothetical protein